MQKYTLLGLIFISCSLFYMFGPNLTQMRCYRYEESQWNTCRRVFGDAFDPLKQEENQN